MSDALHEDMFSVVDCVKCNCIQDKSLFHFLADILAFFLRFAAEVIKMAPRQGAQSSTPPQCWVTLHSFTDFAEILGVESGSTDH